MKTNGRTAWLGTVLLVLMLGGCDGLGNRAGGIDGGAGLEGDPQPPPVVSPEEAPEDPPDAHPPEDPQEELDPEPTPTFTLSYSAGPGGSITGDVSQQVPANGDGSPVEAVPASGNTFYQWSDGRFDNPRIDVNVQADLAVIAGFVSNPPPSPPSPPPPPPPPQQSTYTLTYVAGVNGSIAGISPQVVEEGENGEPVTAIADDGYVFESWSDGIVDNPRADTEVNNDIEVTAVFVLNLDAPVISATPGDGEVTLEWGSVEHATGYELCWSEDSISDFSNCSPGGTLVLDVSSPHSVTELKNGTEFFFRVAATLNGKVGPPSEEASATTPFLEVVDLVPADEEVDVPLSTPVSITFSHPVDTSTLTAQSFSSSCDEAHAFQLSRDDGFDQCVGGNHSFTEGNTVFTFAPLEDLLPDSVYYVALHESVMAIDGAMLVGSYFTHFTTEAGSADAACRLYDGEANEPYTAPVGECVNDDDCGGGVCDFTTSACVECIDDGHCGDGVCDTTVNACVNCLDDDDCGGGGLCDADANRCFFPKASGSACDDGFCDGLGNCLLNCQPGFSDCGGTCVNLVTDGDNCGGCGIACEQGQSCNGGACEVIFECTLGSQEECDPGFGVGQCAQGTRTCQAGSDGGTFWGDCVGKTPSPEVCDGIDNDCNGVVDDGAPCPDGNMCIDGACQAVGKSLLNVLQGSR